MDIGVKQERLVAGSMGALWQDAHTSSLGSLPQGELRLRSVPLTNPSAESEHNFLIGAEVMNAPRDPEERQRAYMATISALARPGSQFGHPRELLSPDRVREEYTATHAAVAIDAATPRLPESPDFLNQGLLNPLPAARK